MATRQQPGREAGPSPRASRRPAARRAGLAGAALALLIGTGTLAGGGPVAAIPSAPGAGGAGGGTEAGPAGTVPGAPVPDVPTPRDEAVEACLAGDRPVVDVDPVLTASYPEQELELDPATVFDARGSTFDNSELNRAGFGFGVRIRPGFPDDLCVVGGSIRTTLDPEDTPWDTWHRVAGIEVKAPGVTVVGTTLRNQGDLVSFIGNADGWSVIGVAADGGPDRPGAYIHDDCIENDSMLSGRVLDSKFDGCFSFLSATHASDRKIDGGENAVEVRGTLVRLQPYRNSFNVPKYGEGNHGGFFKWARTDSDVMIPPSLTVTDSVFRADGPAPFGGNENGFLGLPDGTRCERVLLIGAESWPADELASWTDQCDDLQLGTEADWDAAVDAWDAAHPVLRDLAGQGRDAASAALGF